MLITEVETEGEGMCFFLKTIVTNKANSQIRVAVIQVVHVLMNKLLGEGVILFSVPQNLGQYFFYTQ